MTEADERITKDVSGRVDDIRSALDDVLHWLEKKDLDEVLLALDAAEEGLVNIRDMLLDDDGVHAAKRAAEETPKGGAAGG